MICETEMFQTNRHLNTHSSTHSRHAHKLPCTPTHSCCAARRSANDLILSRRSRGRDAFAACCVTARWMVSGSCKKMHHVKTCLLRRRLARNDSYLPPSFQTSKARTSTPTRNQQSRRTCEKIHFAAQALFHKSLWFSNGSLKSSFLWRNRAPRPVLSRKLYLSLSSGELYLTSKSKCFMSQISSI